MRPITLSPASGRYLSFGEREEIAILRAQGLAVREIARHLGWSPSTISRELRRNAATRQAPVFGPDGVVMGESAVGEFSRLLTLSGRF